MYLIISKQHSPLLLWMEYLLISMTRELDSITSKVSDKLPVVLPDTASVAHHYRLPPEALPLTLKRALKQTARCGMSTRGHWDGPVISNQGRSYKFELFVVAKYGLL